MAGKEKMMRRNQTIFIVVVSVLAGLISLLAVAPSLAREGIAVERLGAESLTVEPQIAFERAVLRVSGPRGYGIRQSFEAGAPITVDLFAGSSPAAETRDAKDNSAADARGAGGAEAIDGRFKYEVIFTEPGGSTRVFSGLFFVQGGSVVSRGAMRDSLAGIRRDLAGLARDERSETAIERIPPTPTLTNVDDVLQVQDTAVDGQTHIFLGSSPIPPYSNWHIRNDYGDINFREYDGSGFEDLVTIEQGGGVGFGTTSPFGSIDFVDSNSFAQITLSTDGGVGYLGTVQIVNGTLALEGQYEQDTFSMNLYAPGYSVNIDYYGQVGFGTTSPGADVEIYDFSSYAALRLNNGTASWAFSNTPGGDFTVNKIGTGGQEFTVRTRNNGDGVPTMKVQGTVEATGGFLNSSSRNIKTDFATLDSKEVLARLADVPVMSWRYKEDHQAARHAGPTAEDFQAAFQLGDGETISTIDADGVALAAIQGLHSMLQEKEAELEELRAHRDQEIADLVKRLAALEERLQAHPPGGS